MNKTKILKKGNLIVGLLLVIVTSGLLIFLLNGSKSTVIEDTRQMVAKSVSELEASGTIQVKNISKTQTIEATSKLVTIEDLIGRYQFNYTGANASWVENQSRNSIRMESYSNMRSL